MSDTVETKFTYTNADVENLRLKFRQEAIRACQEAERRGMEEGSASMRDKLRCGDYLFSLLLCLEICYVRHGLS